MIRTLICLSLALSLAACGGERRAPTPAPVELPRVTGVLSTKSAKQLFGGKSNGSDQSAAPFGFYSKGCLAGGVQLPETGPTWQAMRLSRNRNWGHPELVDFLKQLSRKVAALPGTDGIYVGDMSQPRGGPMLTGHASHQIGLDADIWLRNVPDLGMSRAKREDFPPVSMWRSKGAYVNSDWTRVQHEMVKAAAKDPRVERIFIFPGAKVQMCNDEKGDRGWLRKVRPLYGHYYHMHVRLSCPKGARGCVAQTPPPAGDGCAEAQAWVNNILNPPPPKPRDPNAPAPKPKRDLTMGDLPAQCATVLAAD
ncbi:penicillin-insensitive murein endopeptidase [Salipiger sp.]|uniref:penicillin-insensitive murein endopeptidase n=1 Tax=Salipiger sp. TaxID=2078585 RepID=UPI003A97424B